jgi:(p)ppGpp synthase/HD superfamily hydrolase
MVTPQLKNFFDYKKIVDKNPQFVVDQIKNNASTYLSDIQILEIQRAYDYAKKVHEGQMRQS